MNKVPILFLTFNRPETTQKVFDVVKKYRPSQLFIAQDGPRTDTEKILTDHVKNIFSIDRPCDTHFLIRDTNLGCEKAIVGAIDWFFEHVPYGAILEDDCVPSVDFFDFCMAMGSKYVDNKTIVGVSGSNFLQKVDERDSYIFTKHNPLLWGRATWKDRREKYASYPSLQQILLDGDMPIVEQGLFTRPAMREYMLGNYWDAHWYLVCYYNKGLTIVPTKNMITNVGMLGIHSERSGPYHNLPVFDFIVENIEQQPSVSPNMQYDTEMKVFIRRMYIYNKIVALLRQIGLYSCIKKLVIYRSNIFYMK